MVEICRDEELCAVHVRQIAGERIKHFPVCFAREAQAEHRSWLSDTSA